jgi:2-polyprenyl-6-methoxyphenol hydroxylase-like FAD-dependent oxidoreductase
VDAGGQALGRVQPDELMNNDIELPRGELTTLLYGLTTERPIRYRFNDSIEALEDDGVGVDVRFESGGRQRFDVVVGADGLHSRTRRLVFGPELPFNHALGARFNLFSLPNTLGLAHGAIIYSEPGRTAGLLAVRDSRDLFGFLMFVDADPARLTAEAQLARTEAVFAPGGWEVPRLLEAMRHAPDLFYDSVSQIRMPGWSRGRVALVGDAAYAPSFRSGQGTSLALVGAYVLAGELASHADPAAAFAAYERRTRPYVEANQALAVDGSSFMLLPRTPQELATRNQFLEAFRPGGSPGERQQRARSAHALLALPDYVLV